MFTSIRYFTRDEAETLLPRLVPGLLRIKKEKERVDAKLKEWGLVDKAGQADKAALLRGQIEFLAKSLQEEIEEVQKHGCLLKDLNQGLVDFPARVEGREGYLCWRLGESAIRHWHGLSEGYQGRKPL